MHSSSSATNSSLSSFSDECEASLPQVPTFFSIDSATNGSLAGKKPVHKIEPIFNNEKAKMRIFLEDGSLAEYCITDLTTAEELVEELASRHSLGSDMRRYRLTLSEARDASWRSIRYIRPQQKLKEVSQWTSLTETTICTLRVVIVPSDTNTLAETEPITFTYLYRQSINDFVRERAGSEMTVDTAVQLTALLILDESLCTNIRTNILVKRSWLLRQLLPRSLLDQFSMKQLRSRVRYHLHEDSKHNNQLSVARKFMKIFSENTRSFAGKLFPVKFPDKHRDSILLVSPRHPIAILDQARRVNSPIITLISSWSHLSRVIVKQYRNGVAVHLLTNPRTSIVENSPLLPQEISFLIHTNLLNDLMAFIEGYSQLESIDYPLSIERISHTSKSPSTTTTTTSKSKRKDSSYENQLESSRSRSPFMQRILTNRKNHRTYNLIQEKPTPPASPSLYELTRQFFNRNSPKTLDLDEHETVSNVPNRTTLVTWRSIADTQALNPPPPPPIFYRTVIDVKQTGQMTSVSDEDDEPDVIDLTTSYGYYGSVSFPIRPPSPFADGLIWSQMCHQRPDHEENDRMMFWSSSTKQLSDNFNTNNSNNNNLLSQSSASSRLSSSWKQTFERILKRNKRKKGSVTSSETSENSTTSRTTNKHVHWIDHDQAVFDACHQFVENLKLFVQHILDNQYEEIYLKHCRIALDQLRSYTDCSQLKKALDHTIELANNKEKHQLLQQQTLIAQLISRTILSS